MFMVKFIIIQINGFGLCIYQTNSQFPFFNIVLFPAFLMSVTSSLFQYSVVPGSKMSVQIKAMRPLTEGQEGAPNHGVDNDAYTDLDKVPTNKFIVVKMLGCCCPKNSTQIVFYWTTVASWCSVCFCVVLCVCFFCTGHCVMVPLNLTCLHYLQHSFFEHLYNLYKSSIIYGNIMHILLDLLYPVSVLHLT